MARLARERGASTSGNGTWLLREIVGDTPVALAVFDREMRYLAVSRKYLEMFGIAGRDLVGLSHYEVFPDIPERWRVNNRRALAGEAVGSAEEPWERADGRVEWVRFDLQPWRDPGGRIAGLILFSELITERKRLEEQREDFLRAVSHDLRNPLAVVIGQSDWLRRLLASKQEGRESAAAESILKSARRMNAMIQDLVESSRLEAGQLKLHPEPTDVVELVRDVAGRVGTLEDRARIRIESDEPVPPVTADVDHIERAVVNLITNALKYSPPEAPVVVRVGRDGPMAVIAVTDQGAGIPAEEQPRIFERFYRTKMTEKAEGLGLGLYITRLIVEAHGGRVSVESQVGRGSTFRIHLPLAAGAERQGRPGTKAA